MNWINRIIEAGKNIKQNFHERATKADIAKSDWVACCKGPIEKKVLKQNQWVCIHCSKHFRIKPAGEDSRFKYTFDNGVYEIIDTPKPQDDLLSFHDTKPYKQRLKEAEDNELLKRKDYNILLMLANKKETDVLTSHEVIGYWMKQYNIYSGLKMFDNKIGIFRSVKYIEHIKKDTKHNFNKETMMVIKNWNNTTGHYLQYNCDAELSHDIMNVKAYIHMTSPIRRLIDLLNQTYS